jgi:hypothetical protein
LFGFENPLQWVDVPMDLVEKAWARVHELVD